MLEPVNDEPALVDQLKRAKLVQEVGETVAHCPPPQVFGIHGDWGLGKTSFLHQLEHYLTGRSSQHAEGEEEQATSQLAPVCYDDVATVWFEAWRYQHEDAPVVALLQEIRSQLSAWAKFWQYANKLSEVAVRTALLSFEDLTKKIGFQASKAQDAGERWEREHLAMALPSNTIREQLEKAIGDLLPSSSDGDGSSERQWPKPASPRVVILVDDLDRCEPEAAYRLLEGLKIYLTLPNCVFVLGMNQRVIEASVATQMIGGAADPESAQAQRAVLAENYLEKICQDVWRLPTVDDPKQRLLGWLPDRTEVQRRIKTWIAAAIGDETRALPPNPRRLKGLANLLQRFSARLLEHTGGQDAPEDDARMIRHTRIMLIAAYVYQFHRDLYRRWENDPELFNFIYDWSRGVAVELAVFKQLDHSIGTEQDPASDRKKQGERRMSTFPDPGSSQVFWMEPLLARYGGEMNPDDFRPYLRG